MSPSPPSTASSAPNGQTATGQVQTNAGSASVMQTPAAAEPSKPGNASTVSNSGPPKPQYSASTEELLKRVTASASARAGTPGWEAAVEAARAKVLQSMKTTSGMSTSSPSPPVSAMAAPRGGVRGRGAGRGGATRGSHSVANDPATPIAPAAVAGAQATSSTPPSSGRGRGRAGRPRAMRASSGRGRGGGKGGKRKKADSDDDESDGESDASESYTPVATTTKSGRSVSKPTQWVPTIPEPTQGTKRKRPYKRATESSVCKICLRGTSPANNQIVFCDGCNSGYHQYCHQPAIDMDVIAVPERQWHCSDCQKAKETAAETPIQPVQEPVKMTQPMPVGKSALVSGEQLSLSMDEQKAYLSAQPREYLVNLLLHASTLHPDLPVFAQNARTFITHGPFGKPVPAIQPPSPTAEASQATTQATDDKTPQSVPAPDEASQIQRISELTATATATVPPNGPGAASEPLTNSGKHSEKPKLMQPPDPPTSASSTKQKEIDPDSGLELEPYDGYDTDPPAHYVKPGSGLARTLRPEADDLEWLVDDNDEVFSHSYHYPDSELGSKGMNGLGSGTGFGDIAMDLSGA